MASAAGTYVLMINSSDLERLARTEYNRPLYVHTYTDLLLFSLLVVVAFVSNAVLSTSLATNRYLSQISSYAPILGLTLVQLLDDVFNAIVSLAYMSRVVWDMGYPLCAVHNFCSHLTLGLSPLLLALTTLDRYLCLHRPELYRVHMTCARLRLLAVMLLLIAALSAVPYLTPALTSRPFPARFSCAGGHVDDVSSVYYVYCWTALVVSAPLLVALCLAIVLVRTLWLDRVEKRRVQSRAWLEAKGIPLASGFRPVLAQNEVRSVVLCLALILVYMSCSLPFVIHAAQHQLDNSKEEEEEEKQHAEVCVTPAADVCTSWFRYLATGLHSLVVFSLCDDVRQETVVLLSRWREEPSSVMEEATATVDDIVDTRSRWIRNLFRWQKDVAITNDVGGSQFSPVVLFPTDVGLQTRYSKSNVGANFGYIWCDQLDSCCLQPPPPPPPSVDLRQRRRSPLPSGVKRPNNEVDGVGPSFKKKQYQRPPPSSSAIPAVVLAPSTKSKLLSKQQQQPVKHGNRNVNKRRSRASSVDHVARLQAGRANQRKSRSLDRLNNNPAAKRKTTTGNVGAVSRTDDRARKR